MNQIEYLKARLDELEAKARASKDAPLAYDDVIHGGIYGDTAHEEAAAMASQEGCTEGAVAFLDAVTPDLVLAQITALRRIVRDAEESEQRLIERGHKQISLAFPHRSVVRWLIQPFAGRPDFPAEWKA